MNIFHKYSTSEAPWLRKGSLRRQETWNVCEAPVVKRLGPCLPLTTILSPIGDGKESGLLYVA